MDNIGAFCCWKTPRQTVKADVHYIVLIIQDPVFHVEVS